MKFVGIVAIILGFMLMPDLPIFGLLGLALGIYVLYDVKRKKNAKTAPQTAPIQSAVTIPDEQESMVVKAVSHPRVAIEVSNSDSETIKAVGISRYKDAVMSLGLENEEYSYTKSQIIEESLEYEEIWQYSFPEYEAEFVYEPDNKYDSNAIAIYVEGKKIGYVERDLTDYIRDIIDSGKLNYASCRFIGGNYKIYDSVEDCIIKEERNFGARISLDINE